MKKQKEVYIVSAVRTPIGSLLGALSSVTSPELGTIVVKEAMKRAKIVPEMVDEVFMGSVLQAAAGQNIARQAAVGAGIPIETTATTVNMVCGSGIKSIITAAQTIMCGDNDIVVAGGAESMSNVPYYATNIRKGNKLGDVKLIDGVVFDGLTDIFNHYHMGITAENVAEQYGVSREMQDAFALMSQKKAAEAQRTHAFDDEIVPVVITDRKGNQTIVDMDEHPRPGTSMEGLAKLKPAFKKDGTVTAGNASGINDGAAAVVLMSEEKMIELGATPIAKIVSYAGAGVDPSVMGLGPIPAVEKALKQAELTVDDIDLFEINEAFASQSIAVAQKLQIPNKKLNVNGGAISLGHPIGASGTRILVTLIHALKKLDKQSKKLGAASLCIGGGMGVCIVVEAL